MVQVYKIISGIDKLDTDALLTFSSQGRTRGHSLKLFKRRFFIWVLRPFQEYFTYIEPIVHQRWAKTGEPGEKPPDHP